MRLLPLLVLAVTVAACDTSTPDADLSQVRTDAVEAEIHRVDGAQSVASIQRSTAHFHRVERALEAGYAPASPCVNLMVDGNEIAAMGYHYLNGGLLFDGVVDPSKPEILLYEPMKNGRLRLVAVEFMVPAEVWAGDELPTFEGVEFDVHLTPETMHGIPFPHYDLHVWTWRNNPDGMFAPFNPKVSCAHAPAPAA